MKNRYWSCSKFADWIRGTPKIDSGTCEEWNAWERQAKKKKIRYWLAEDGLDHLQSFVVSPIEALNTMRFYFVNRWISKTHALTSNLKRGQWHDLDTRLLHSVFDALVDFVEVETAWLHIACSKEARAQYQAPWHQRFFRRRIWRCPEAGVAHLEWAGGLVNDEDWMDKNDPDFGNPTSQALAATEVLALYRWWKVDYPKRPDPHEVSGWSALCNERQAAARERGDDSWTLLTDERTDEERERTRKVLDATHAIQEQYDQEDTAMLVRLVKVRHALWT
jgi:hypothetical protein